MVVEDEWLIRATLVEVLADAGFHVLEAEQGDVALEALERYAPAVDLLFTDIRMPGSIDGLELARRASKLLPRLAIVVASGNLIPSQNDMPTGSRFLSKPYSYRDIPGQLKAILSDASALYGNQADRNDTKNAV